MFNMAYHPSSIRATLERLNDELLSIGRYTNVLCLHMVIPTPNISVKKVSRVTSEGFLQAGCPPGRLTNGVKA